MLDTPNVHELLSPQEVLAHLENRLGRVHSRLRLGLEQEHEAQAFGQGLTFLHLENMFLIDAFIDIVLRGTGFYWRGYANAARVSLRNNVVFLPNLPNVFNGYTVLHLSDLHADTSQRAFESTTKLVDSLQYDLCVLTGDLRGRTYGDYGPTLKLIARLRESLCGPIYAVLGNHDTIKMVPDLEAMGIAVLLNEAVAIRRGGDAIYLAGVDDAHFYRADNIEKAAIEVPEDCTSILLSHTPEVYRQAAHAGFNLMLSGHTHGGQICLLARRDSNFPSGQVAAPTRGGPLEVRSDGRLYVCWLRDFGGYGSLQQHTRNYVAPTGRR